MTPFLFLSRQQARVRFSTNEKTIAQAKMTDAWLGEQCVPRGDKKNALMR
jgi:hypothetical protein